METYGNFYIEHKDKLFGYLLRMTGDYYLAGDLMQESFTRHMERYKQKEPRKALLYTIARNAYYDYLRKSKRSVPIKDGQGISCSDGERAIMIRSEYRAVLAAMDKLATGERDILSLIVSTDLSYQEIASIMGISEANVKVKVHRARVALKEILTQEEK